MSGSEPQIRKDSRLFEELCQALLRRGNAVKFRVNGQSMCPNLADGDTVVVEPANAGDLRRGEIVLARSEDGLLVHRVTAIDTRSGAVTIRSDTGFAPDGPDVRVFGKVLSRRNHQGEESLTHWRTRFSHPAKAFALRFRAAAVLRLRRLLPLFFGIVALLILGAAFCAPAARAQADLQLTQTASATAVAVNTDYTYTEVVKNNTAATTVPTGTIIVYQQTPPNTNYRSYIGTNWNCTNPGSGNAGPIVCTYNAALAGGATASTLTITMRVNTGTATGTTIQNSATVTSGTVDPTPANNTSITSIYVEPAAASDLAISMGVSPTPVFIFSNLTYTIQVQNLGQAAAPVSANVLSDTLPAGVTFVSVSASAGWSCAGTTTVQCSITSAMAMGSVATISITVTAPSTASTLTNTATVTLTGDLNASNNSATAYTVVQPLVCATPGRDGTGGTLTGVVNAYYPPSSTGTLASAATSVALGAASGASTAIAVGDLLLIIQMQGATINSTNTSSYGDGLAGDPATGSTSLGSSGLFEFITATNAVPTTGGTLQFTGSGPTGGLLNSYSSVAATTTQAQQTYQVIRVPQYTSATLSSGLVPLGWTGKLGGVLAIDVSSRNYAAN